MLRQFDVIVVSERFKDGTTATPPFTDPSLGWFFVDNINNGLENCEAEWVIVATDHVEITREFLNNLAECNASFPMADALAPRIKAAGKFLGGSIIAKNGSFVQISEDSPIRFVAGPHPDIAAFSRRIVQRTGRVDTTLPAPFQLIDYSLRMLHAGGRMLSIPYLVIEGTPSDCPFAPKECNAGCVRTLYKSLGIAAAGKFTMRHPKSWLALFNGIKALNAKREAAISLSKMTPEMFKDIKE
ncbi:MAG: hypothetical protein J6U20_07365 [Fibrobacter sp.]|nr:hypothetical protein [Fibrobacter sp.]